MLKRGPILLLLGLALAFVFLWGVAQLFALRFATGDVYPFYSTLRPDPLGAQALHDSLATLPGIETTRGYRPLSKLREAPDTTIWMLGAGERFLGSTMDLTYWGDLAEISTPHTQSLLAGGARLVFTLLPTTQWAESVVEAEKREEKQEGKKAAPKKGDEMEDEKKPVESLFDRWGVKIKRFTRGDDAADVVAPAVAQPRFPVEPEISWHTTLHFAELDPAWRVIYAVRGEPVLIERRAGLGSLVLSTDSFFAGNEALRSERAPRLLAWLQGSNRRALFDEAHLGVAESPGIASLARKYNLHGVAAGLLLLALLFVWKNMSPFVPPHAGDPAAADTIVSTRAASAGLVNLLRRSIPARDILGVCWREWRKTFAQRKDVAGAEATVASEGAKDPVAAYRQIASLLARAK